MQTFIFLGYRIDFTYTTFLCPSIRRLNLLLLENICLATRRYFWVSAEVWGNRLFSRAGCLVISQALASPRAVPVAWASEIRGIWRFFCGCWVCGGIVRSGRNYFRPYLSIPRVCHSGAAYELKFSYYFQYIIVPNCFHSFIVFIAFFSILSLCVDYNKDHWLLR